MLEALYIKGFIPVSAINFIAAMFQAVQTADTHSILGIAAIIQAVMSFGLLAGALGLAYGYGALNNQVRNISKVQEESEIKLAEFIRRIDEANERRNARLWEKLDVISQELSKQQGRDETLIQLTAAIKKSA